MRIFEGYQKGINLGGWLSQCVSYESAHFATFITKKDIRQIAGWGFDHVRVPVDYDILVAEDGEAREEGFACLDNVISWCREYGLRMILDLHKTKGYMFDTGAVAQPDLFFQQTQLQDFFVALWERLAKRYGHKQEMLAFELLNEIVNPAYTEKWNEIALRAIRAIRSVAPDNYILVGGTNYNSVTKVPDILRPDLFLPGEDKIVYNFHCYEPLIFTHQKAYWVEGMTADFEMHYPASVEELRSAGAFLPKKVLGAIYEKCLDGVTTDFFDALFAAAVKICEERNVPLYCGEYGVIDRAPVEDTLKWIQDIHRAFEKYHIGRALWNYKQKDFGLTDEHYAAIRQAIIRG